MWRPRILWSAALSALWLFPALAAAAEAPRSPAADSDEAGFRPIFNGHDLTGWDGEPGFWSVRDGAIVGEATRVHPAKANTFLVWRAGGDVDDFELRCSFRCLGNSGIQYRSVEPDPWRVRGYQADMESGPKWTGGLYDEGGRGQLCSRGEKVEIAADGTKQVTRFAGSTKLEGLVHRGAEWNTYDVIAQGHHFVQKINGHLMAEALDNDAKHFRRSGILALQIHSGLDPMKVEFKDLRLKRLKLSVASKGERKIVLIAGRPSHGPGAHEFNAGMLLLKKRLNRVPGILAVSYHNGWPTDPSALDNADAVALYMDGGSGHPVLQHLDEIDRLMRRGVGLMCMHYAVEVPAGVAGEDFRRWIGGYYETGWSVNPTWKLEAELDPTHPIARGVAPFTVTDEWYFNMRFRDDRSGIRSILQGRPNDEARNGRGTWPPGAKQHILAAKGRIETLMWAVERPDGGRGVGYTGGHSHRSWANDNVRKLVLNALVWVAGAEVPAGGIVSEPVSEKELAANLDPKGR